jgi:hypothetical protein
VKHGGANYIEKAVVVDGVHAIRRRKSRPASKSSELYLHVPMPCITALGRAAIPATAWPLALWVLWYHMVVRRPASVTAEFASRAGIDGRAARRYAVEALATSGLFHVSRYGTQAVRVAPNAALMAMMAGRPTKG